MRIGSIIEIGPAEAVSRPSDRAIADIAENGIYRPSRHLEQARFEGRVPGGNSEGFVDAHVRRLEALRRAGIVKRIDVDQWRIPEDFAERASTYDAGRNTRANVRILSAARLESQIGADGATWLDRRLLSGDASDLAPSGFGREVRDALARRRQHHIEQGDAVSQPNGGTAYRRNLLAGLREREIARVGAEMAANESLPFRPGRRWRDRQRQVHRLRAALIRQVRHRREGARVHAGPMAARHRSPAWTRVIGVVQAGSVSWQLGRQRGLEM